ncbi:MAG TPA: sodium:solute symporter family protein, partial [Vicinamibacterales bacterium]|nr:sodium:solute symporter family protein [Vicinamibacterales bacterium]
AYSALLIGIGQVIGRRVRGTSDFFVAGRSLGPGLIFSTMLAANIGAGSTVNATALGYSGGVAAWWWVGSAALGSAILAFWIGPAMRREAAARDLRTVGDFLEHRYGPSVRALIAALLWVGSLFILAGQLFAMGVILETVANIPSWAGCVIGGVVITAYFTAGGLLTSAWVNMVQLAVKLGGFAIAVPLVLDRIGGIRALALVQPDDHAYWTFWQVGPPGIMWLAMLTPAFIVSPGLLQKIFGARDDRAVRIGVGLNALGLFLYAGVPVVLGIAARLLFPALAIPDLALPTILMRGLPPVVGALGLAAVFSAEISAADAVLFMLTTSLSQDLYRRFINPSADDARVLLVTRLTAIVSGVAGVVLAIGLGSVLSALSIFYSLLGVSLFVPILAGLYIRRAGTPDALAAIGCGVAAMLGLQFTTAGRGVVGITPALGGIIAATAGFTVVFLSRSRTYERAV